MRAIERATRADLRTMPESVRDSAQARCVIDLAQRLDGEEASTVAVLLARELRMGMAELRRLAHGDVGGELDAFLRSISAPALGDGGHRP